MANKYCNLDGNQKIKDEYNKINIGFDKLETDINKTNNDIIIVNNRVNNIITTPAGSVSAQEIIDARKGKPNLRAKIDSMDNALSEHEVNFANYKFGNRPYTSTGNMEYYVDNTNGNDNNTGLSQQQALKTFPALMQKIPIFLRHTCTIKIIGNYTGNIDLFSIFLDYTLSSSIAFTVEGVNMNSNNYINGFITVSGVSYVQIKNLYVDTTTAYGLRIENGSYARVSDCNIKVMRDSGSAIIVRRAQSWIQNSTFNISGTSTRAIDSVETSHVYSSNNSGNGERFGLSARIGGVITKDGTQPSGSYNDEYITEGGIIR